MTVHWLPVLYANQMSYAQRIGAFFQFALRSAGRAASIAADVVFATSTPLTIALPAIYASRRQGIPMVLEVRDVWPEVPIALGAVKGPLIPFARWLERFAYRNAAAIVALSPDMKASMVNRIGPSASVHVIPNSSDIEMFSVPKAEGQQFREQYDWLRDRPLILYAGTLGLVNGVGYFVHIAAALQEIAPEVCCLVVGNGREEDLVRSTAKMFGVLDRNFFMLPSLPKKAMPPLLSAADITTSFVIDVPALWANSANKFFDSLAAGRPIAINHEGWQADLLRESGAGLVLPANDPAAAAQSLARAIADEQWLAQAATAATELAHSHFDRNQLASQLETILVQAVPGHSNVSA